MVNNYWKIATRNLLAQKWYSAINIFGLAIGISCTFLISLYVLDELRYDRFHEKSDLIYRIGTGIKQENGSEIQTAAIPAMWAPTLTEELPNVASFVRFYKYRSEILMSNEQTESRFYEGNFFWGDSTVFDVFTFPLISGRPNAALEAPNSVVISESAARKYFGEEAPIGKSLRYVNQNVVFDLEVTGVMQDVPRTSHFRPDFLASLSTFKPGTWLWKYDLPTSWTNLFYQSYVVLSPQTDCKKIETELSALLERHIGEAGAAFRPFLQPLTSIHLYSNLLAEFEVNSDVKYLYIFSLLAFLILLVACINL
jgi:putative ABC transport system permease protein